VSNWIPPQLSDVSMHCAWFQEYLFFRISLVLKRKNTFTSKELTDCTPCFISKVMPPSHFSDRNKIPSAFMFERWLGYLDELSYL
jgi:hypothetical protein